jgi:DNA-binding PadR family transcriptional regulator
MSTTRMMILGIVRIFQPVHGYDVHRELESWRAEHWASVAPGSIYHALKKLAGEGLLAEVATEQVGARPARTTYEITPKGEAEFQGLLRRYWWEYTMPVDPFMAAFAFLPALPPREAVAALRSRAAGLRLYVESTRARLDQGGFEADPPHVAELFELTVARSAVEADWCQRVAHLIEEGRLAHPATNPPAGPNAGPNAGPATDPTTGPTASDS